MREARPVVRSAKPSWLKIRPPRGHGYVEVNTALRRLGLNTVCAEARCPNASECWSRHTATFMVLGATCTRNCGFCAVRSAQEGDGVSSSEPKKIAEAVSQLGLKYAVLTSVTRDDLPDRGAGHFAACVRKIRNAEPAAGVEVLIPDFDADRRLLEKIIAAGPDVIGHNIETVRRLQEKVRDRRAGYEKSLRALKLLKEISPGQKTKSGLMLGLGENRKEVLETLQDLRNAGADLLTIGQYLKPAQGKLDVARYIPPKEFEFYGKAAREMGFRGVASAPFVRSSYLAENLYIQKATI